MKIKFIPIKVSKNHLDPKTLDKAIKKSLDIMEDMVADDFKKTYATWEHKPRFQKIKIQAYVREISTTDQIYNWVNKGTKAHVIRPTRGKVLAFPKSFRPKTRTRYIASYRGSKSKGKRYAKIVHHPGTKAREFDTAISERWQVLAPRFLRTAIQLSGAV